MHASPFAIVSIIHATIAAFGYRFTVKKETPLLFTFNYNIVQNVINIGYIFKEKWIVSSMGAFGSSCAASKYIQCIEETDFRFLLEAKRCNMEKTGVCFHVLYPVSVGFFVKGPFTTRRRQKVADFF